MIKDLSLTHNQWMFIISYEYKQFTTVNDIAVITNKKLQIFLNPKSLTIYIPF